MAEERKNQKRLYAWLPLKLYADIQYQANMAGKNITQYVIDALSEHIKEKNDERRL